MSRHTAIVAIILSAACKCSAYDIVPRWGAASLYDPSPPSILISGGKTATSDGTYSSSPNSADLIRLSLSASFSTSSPPYELLNSSSASPAYAWHTLSLTSSNSSSISAFSFGGDGGQSTPLPAGTDSSWYLSLPTSGGPVWTQESSSWASQPQRRILHASATGSDGMVYITGGQRNDGSGLILTDAYAFNPNTSVFTSLPTLPRGTAHHISALLSNGTLVILTGIYTSANTGNPTLAETSTIYTLDTKSASPAWWEASVGGTAPPARRGASGVLMADEKLYVVGGTGMSSSGALGDVWVLDMRAGSWSQVSTSGNGEYHYDSAVGVADVTGPSARFDHTGVNVGNNQMLVVGGFGVGQPADAGTYIFDTGTNSWVSSFATVSPPSTATPSSVPSSSSTSAPSDVNANSTTAMGQSQSNGVSQTVSSTDTATAPPSSSTPANAGASSAQLTKAAQIGLALGVSMAFGVLAALVVITIRRRRAGKGIYGAPPGSPSGWLSPRPPPVEKDGQALLGDPRSGAAPGEWSEKGGIIGLGLGAVGAGLSAFRLANKERDYHQLDDEAGGAPARRSTRRAGAGIKLIGPRSNPSTSRPQGPKSPPRVDILHDEDSRTFSRQRAETEDWKVDRRGKDEWRSAATVLGHDDPIDPFEDAPLIRGGPVPTPGASRVHLGPFDDEYEEVDITTAVSRGPGLYQLPPISGSDPLDIAGLLAPRSSHHDSSLPRSSHSRASTVLTASDAEEGSIHHAQFASQASALYSPQEPEYIPIKRDKSFFRRMASGGISTLMGAATGRRASVQKSDSRDIRDPTPGPSALWPVESRDEVDDDDLPRPPTSWRDRATHGKGPSLGSLASARSMRDMVIVQREGTDSSEASMVVEEDMGSPIHHTEGVLDGMSPIHQSETFAERLDRSFFASPTEEDFGILRPLDISTSSAQTATTGNSSSYTKPSLAVASGPIIVSETPSPSGSNRSAVPLPPSGSPLPKHLVEHRRPVKDMVFSINKRASTTLPVSDPMSPTSQYSVTPGQTPMMGGGPDRRGSWQVRRKESLVVANPDKRRRGGAA